MNDPFDIDQPKDVGLVEKCRLACEEAAELQTTIAGYEDAASAARKRLMTLVMNDIPTAMAEAGVGDTFSLASGHKIKIVNFISGALPKEPEERKKAFGILNNLGGGALIKTHFNLIFGKGEKQEAERLAKSLVADGFDFEEKEDVHASSLKAFVKERMRDGSEVPLDDLGLYAGSVAKITVPKESSEA